MQAHVLVAVALGALGASAVSMEFALVFGLVVDGTSASAPRGKTMQCSEVGAEVWLLFALSAVGVVLFLVAPRSFQSWIRVRRATHPLIRGLPDAFFLDGVWAIRALGVIPALMLLAASMGVYCYFHGPG